LSHSIQTTILTNYSDVLWVIQDDL